MVAALLIKQWKKSFEVKKLKKLFDTLVDGSVALISRFLPDVWWFLESFRIWNADGGDRSDRNHVCQYRASA